VRGSQQSHDLVAEGRGGRDQRPGLVDIACLVRDRGESVECLSDELVIAGAAGQRERPAHADQTRPSASLPLSCVGGRGEPPDTSGRGRVGGSKQGSRLYRAEPKRLPPTLNN